ncbi:MAG: ATP-binding protein [Actinobacteria bacterium]|nr:ATP-binding protein [Actinomycetota bacterium]
MQEKNDFTRFLSELNIKNSLKIEEDLGSGFVRLKISEAERRQALQDIKTVEEIAVEFLRNSRDSSAGNIFIATKKTSEKKRLIYCIDDGNGIPEKFHNLIFQSRVTSKLEEGVKDPYGYHGRGMALFSIKLNVEDVTITFSDINRGTCIYAEIDLEKITEKKDQSVYPNIIKNGDSTRLTGGINNIIKILLEFVLHSPSINIYYGSPTQIIFTMSEINKNSAISAGLNLPGKFENTGQVKKLISGISIPVTQIPLLASSPAVLGELLKTYFKMDISERGLQRIFYGEIKPLDPLNDYLMEANGLPEINENFNASDEVTAEEDLKTLSAHKRNSGSKIPLNDSYRQVKMHDEIKLANRFKDEEIRYIINMLKNEITRLGSKHFISVDSDVVYKKVNNTINFTVNLKQTD